VKLAASPRCGADSDRKLSFLPVTPHVSMTSYMRSPATVPSASQPVDSQVQLFLSYDLTRLRPCRVPK
jgi:hypothetical protein